MSFRCNRRIGKIYELCWEHAKWAVVYKGEPVYRFLGIEGLPRCGKCLYEDIKAGNIPVVFTFLPEELPFQPTVRHENDGPGHLVPRHISNEIFNQFREEKDRVPIEKPEVPFEPWVRRGRSGRIGIDGILIPECIQEDLIKALRSKDRKEYAELAKIVNNSARRQGMNRDFINPELEEDE